MLELLADLHAWVALLADGFDVPIPRGYIYFAAASAAAVEAVEVTASRNRSLRRRRA